MFDCISVQANQIITELISLSKLKAGDIIVVGCSSSEVAGHKIGTDSSPDIAKTIVNAILPVIRENNLFLAAQCCEHLNRAIIIEHDAAIKYNLTEVNVIPQPKAGGSFATAAYNAFENPVAVESLCHKAAAGRCRSKIRSRARGRCPGRRGKAGKGCWQVAGSVGRRRRCGSQRRAATG